MWKHPPKKKTWYHIGSLQGNACFIPVDIKEDMVSWLQKNFRGAQGPVVRIRKPYRGG